MDAPDRDLELLRGFRAHDAEPPAGLLERLEEDLTRIIDLDVDRPAESVRRRPVPKHHGWLRRLARPALVAGAAATLAVGIGVVGARGDGDSVTGTSIPTSTQAGTNLLEGAASTLFGGASQAAASAAPPPVVGVIDGREDDPRERAAVAAGPDADASNLDVLQRLSRDPLALRDLMRAAADDVDEAGDPGDRVSFLLTMRLVVDERLPVELRASLLRSLDGIDGIDRAVRAQDALGRSGILLSHFDTRTGVRDQLVLDADGAALLERRSFTTAYVDPACPPGTFTSYALYDSEGRTLEAAQVPMLAWPDVVPSCDGSGPGVG